MRSLTDICRKELETTTVVKVSNLIAKFNSQSCVKIPSAVIGSMAKWILELGAGSYVEEFLNFHAQHVNPSTLAVAPTFFEEVAKARICDLNVVVAIRCSSIACLRA